MKSRLFLKFLISGVMLGGALVLTGCAQLSPNYTANGRGEAIGRGVGGAFGNVGSALGGAIGSAVDKSKEKKKTPILFPEQQTEGESESK